MFVVPILTLLAFIGSVDAKGCFNKDTFCGYSELKKLCNSTSGYYYQERCPKTCGVCGNVCYDEDPQGCKNLKDKCNAPGYSGLATMCKYSCNVCTDEDHCGDVFSACTQMKDFCEVKGFEDVMSQCNYTCGKCECEDLYPDYCEIMKSSCNNAKTRDECPETCGVCHKKCADLRPDCARYANFCNHNEFKVPMRHSCAKTCGLCGEKHTTLGHGGWIYSKAFSAWYKYICESLTFDEMEQRCVEDGGHLASVASSAENQFLSSVNQCSADRIWLGYTYSANAYRWTDGSPIIYSSYYSSCSSSGFCRTLNTTLVGWCGTPCDAVYGGVCKIKI